MGRSRLAGPWLIGLALGACSDPIELETGGGTGGLPTGSTGSTADDTADTGSPVPTLREVDILFVIDNSGSMSEEQALAGAAIAALLDPLEGATPPVDYRIGVTTTDNGNPWCEVPGLGGGLRATSCRSRPEDFVFEGLQTHDYFTPACADLCPLEAVTVDDGHPWIEVSASTGTTNVTTQDVRDAIRCVLPQGVKGCGFESQLESAREALRRFTTAADPGFGFHRAGALLTVIFITDEADCSYNPDKEIIFLPEGNRVFWWDDFAPAPTSAVCWNAGVACVGSGTYDDCVPANLDVNGAAVTLAEAPSEAALHPTSRYTAAFAEVGAYVVAINGVNQDGTVTYADTPQDQAFQADFGIGPGCSSPSGKAVPPVRLRTVLESIGQGAEPTMFSVCADDYTAAFGSISSGILARLP